MTTPEKARSVPTTEDEVSAGSLTDVHAISGVKQLWAETLGDPHICIAVLDGPVDQSDPSLAGANLTQVDILPSSLAGRELMTEHGTHVASIIFGQHDGPVKGIAPRCRGLILPIFRYGRTGSVSPCSQLDLARAISHAIQHGAHIINISGGQFMPSGQAHPILTDAVRSCTKAGVLVVAAAGNEGCRCLHIPGALPSVLAVGAMNARGQPLEFSNWGDAYQTQGVLAPGENIVGASPSSGTAAHSGTSFATPIVSGVAGLLLSAQLKRGQSPDSQLVREAILKSVLGCEHQAVPDCRRLLAGRLNIPGAVSALRQGEITMSDQVEIKPIDESGPSEAFQDPHPDGSATEGGRTTPSQAPVVAVGQEPNEAHAPGGPQVLASTSTSPAAASMLPSQPRIGTMADAPALVPAACTCEGGGAGPAQFVFALGTLGIDFGTEVRRDYFLSTYGDDARFRASVLSPAGIHQLLTLRIAPEFPFPEFMFESEKIIWTLNHDETPIYAIQPTSPFASIAYDRLVGFLGDQIEFEDGFKERLRAEEEHPGRQEEERWKADERRVRTSIAGTLGGHVTLLTGQVVPVVYPDLRGMFNWGTDALVRDLTADQSESAREDLRARLGRVLNRFYYDFRNLGLTPHDRALNYSMTFGANLRRALSRVRAEEGERQDKRFELDSIDVAKSPICRPDSDCWDVKLVFFDSMQPWQSLRLVIQFALDLSDAVPVAIGPPRTWFIR